MFVYSKKIIQFVNDIKRSVKKILSQEIGVKVTGDRFHDRHGRASYPIKIVIFNNKNMLGYFDSNFYELGFHECLMHSNKEQVFDIIKHELAHYLTCIEYGEMIKPHGLEFRAFCQSMGWGEEVYQATICLEGSQEKSINEECAILRKVQKLMALATSSNAHEAEQAMIKSQQLLLKHHLEAEYIEKETEEQIFLKRIMHQKRENAKMRAIARILETFFVSIVYLRTKDGICLEILGSAVNIEIAEYVAGILQHELDALWHLAQKESGLKGMTARNSFYLGVAKGYCEKLQALKREYHHDLSNAVMVIETKLADAKAMVYSRLSSKKSYANHCRESSALGERMGRQFTINPAVQKSSQDSKAAITYK